MMRMNIAIYGFDEAVLAAAAIQLHGNFAPS